MCLNPSKICGKAVDDRFTSLLCAAKFIHRVVRLNPYLPRASVLFGVLANVAKC